MDSNCPSFMATSEGKVIEFLVFSSASKYSSILDSSSMMGLILFTSETRFGEFFVILVVEFINSEHSGKKDISCISSLLDNAPNYLVGCVISYHLSKRKISQIRMKVFMKYVIIPLDFSNFCLSFARLAAFILFLSKRSRFSSSDNTQLVRIPDDKHFWNRQY